MIKMVDPEVIEALCPELRAVVRSELDCGNVITETSDTWGHGCGTVWFAWQLDQRTELGDLTIQRLADYHDGSAEIACPIHKQVLVFGLGNKASRMQIDVTANFT